MRPALLLLAAALTACGAAAMEAYDLRTRPGGSPSAWRLEMTNNFVGGPGLEVNAVRTDSGGHTRYALEITYTGDAWLAIPDGGSIELLLDGVTRSIQGPGSAGNRHVLPDGRVREMAVYPVSAEHLRAIADARAGRVRVPGVPIPRERRLEDVHLQRFREFVARAVEPPSVR